MTYNFDLTSYLSENDNEINFKNIFVDKILFDYFPNINDKLIFLEIGALHGNDSIYFKTKYKNSDVYSIEGSKEVYETHLYNKKNIIKIFNICIFSFDGNITFNIKKNNENGLLSGIHSVYDRGEIYGQDQEYVPCKKLDTFCIDNNIEYIDVLKLDVEGATFDVLNNCNMLTKIKIMHIETEDYPFFKGQKLDSDVEKLLLNNNFKLICKTGYNPTSDGKQYDCVYINTLFFD
jgi:FkbM family methyltransferase